MPAMRSHRLVWFEELLPVKRPETDEELRTRIANAYGTWGAFLSVVIESNGKDLEDCAAHLNLKREEVES